MKISFLDSFEQITITDWNKLNNSTCPLSSYGFFNSLESSQSVSQDRGWQPYHMLIESDETVSGIMPMYLKQHSWGEYVFDWAWAQAYEEHGMRYYPKLVATIPFTPLCSNKLLANDVHVTEVFSLLSEHCQQSDISSWHLLFLSEDELHTVRNISGELDNIKLPNDVYHRHTVQFHWFNKDYQNFDAFINTFTSRKRKNTRKERISILQQGIEIRRLKGSVVTESEIEFFYLTYQLTYMKNGHQPHLTFEFFKTIFKQLSDNILLVIAKHNGENVACALFFYDDKQLYGRYWGCEKPFKNLHFELCYYQGIEFCIENNLQTFNPGTQGEHKIQRGFEPVLTHSYHWIKDTAFKVAIKDFCRRETEHMHVYLKQCQQALPFRNAG